jgi:hydrogenase nickel incorporation protein HypB
MEISIEKKVTDDNDTIAQETNNYLKEKGIKCVNIMGAPGSGKTTFIEGIAKFIPANNIAVIQGDLESDIDKVRLEKSNISTYQINTHSGCHLSAKMVADAVQNMDLNNKKLLLIENVGNLVCPAGRKIGQDMDMVISATTEGSDKPKKYPVIFLDAKLVVISKTDLAEAVNFSEEQYLNDIKAINANTKIVKTTIKEENSFKEAAEFLMTIK